VAQNLQPDLLVIEAAFRDKRGMAVTVDTDVQLDLFVPGEAAPEETITFSSDPAIELQVRGTGTYYFARINPQDYAFDHRGIHAVWSAKLGGQLLDPPMIVQTYQVPSTTEKILLRQEVIDWMKQKLGFPLVVVELNDAHLNNAVDQALEIYNRYIPLEKWAALTTVPSLQKYPLPEGPGRGVVDVQFIRAEGVPLISDPLFGREYPRGQQLDFNQYVLGISFFDTLLRVTSQEAEWDWDENEPSFLFIQTKAQSYKISYRYLLDRRIEQVLPSNHDWFRRMSLAQAKTILGRVRAKYAAIPAASAGSVQLDGNKILDEAEKEVLSLEQDVQRFMRPVPPLWEN